jgi:N-acyl-D-amino-acid deacylase
MFDLIIKNGQVIDGIQDTPARVDLGLSADKIEAIGNLGTAQGKTIIDAKGLAVAPGFIDIHSHTDLELLANPKAESKIRQGVTTELSGNCGGSMFPRKKELAPFEKEIAASLGIEVAWTDLATYHTLLAKRGMAVNHATLVGQATIRELVMGNDRRAPTPGEMEVMKKLVREAMEQGAFGISTGLEYAPDRFSSTPEIIELSRVAAGYGGFYATHMRSEDIEFLEALAEAITIAETAGLPLEISHFKVSGRGNYYKLPMAMDLIERATARGVKITADCYPYTAYNTDLAIMFPLWALDGGQDKFAERLKDPEFRQKMKEDALDKAEGNNGWESMLIQDARKEVNKWLVGKYISEAAQEKKQDPYEFSCDLLISEGGGLSIIGFGMSEEQVQQILKHPLVMLCSDGVAMAPYGPLDRGIPHPRNYGAFPRFLGEYVREKKLLSLPEAIKKVSSMPARKIGLKGRGEIQKGFCADLVIFDPATIADEATYLKPKVYPKGIDYVIVNGQVVIDHGNHTGALPGKALNKER